MTFSKKNYLSFTGMLVVLSVSVFLWYAIHQDNDQIIALSSEYYDHDVLVEDKLIIPIPQDTFLDEKKVELGEKLFKDSRLSKDNTIACTSCHNLMTGGTVPLAKTIGINQQIGVRNSPTVFNSVFNIAQFWDGRAKTLEDQIDGPIHSPVEMGNNWPEIITKLKSDSNYVASFSDIYEEGVTVDSIKNAIATFERSLITPNSHFDRYLRGEQDILTDEEISGYEMFKSLGCISCHQGINIGSNLYQTFGVFTENKEAGALDKPIDFGRFTVTGKENDKFVFKVPTLRNIALTAPYFHDGSVETLEEAVKIMGAVQLGRNLNRNEISKVVSFLKTLTGEYKGKPL